jgi:ankyrin repeat protein
MIHARDGEQKTPLFRAVESGAGARIVRALLELGSDPNAATEDGLTPLMYAASTGKVQIARLLVQAGAYVNFQSRDHQALHCAVCCEQREVVGVLAEFGADLDAKHEGGIRPLHFATGCEDASAESVEQLLMLGADPNAADDDGDSPLHAALERPNIEAAELLLRHGADPLVRNKKGLDPVQIVLARRDFIEAVSTPTHEAAATSSNCACFSRRLEM